MLKETRFWSNSNSPSNTPPSSTAQDPTKALAVALLFIYHLSPVADTDLQSLCLQSLQTDYFAMASIKEALLKKNLASLLQSEHFLEVDHENRPIFKWEVSAQGKKVFEDLPPLWPDNTLKFFHQLIEDCRLHSEYRCLFKAQVKQLTNTMFSLGLSQEFRKQIVFSFEIKLENENLALQLASSWEKLAYDSSFPLAHPLAISLWLQENIPHTTFPSLEHWRSSYIHPSNYDP